MAQDIEALSKKGQPCDKSWKHKENTMGKDVTRNGIKTDTTLGQGIET